MEFLGDAVLGLVVGDHLYREYPGATEGQLTKIRAMVVSAPTLAKHADRMGLGEHLRLGRGEAATGGRKRESNLANAFESLVGAVFLHGGLAEAGEFILRHLREEISEAASGRGWPDFKTTLQERLQSRGQKPIYQLTSEAGPDHGKVFTVAVYAEGVLLGQGSGRTKKEAERVAAEQALKGRD